MDDPDNDGTLEDLVLELVDRHGRNLIKAILIGIMVSFSVAVFSASVPKAASIGTICFSVSHFATWRRFLELTSFAMFCVAAVLWCNDELARQVVTSAAGFFYSVVH
jgi:uncharacterized protein (DUF486 family)